MAPNHIPFDSRAAGERNERIVLSLLREYGDLSQTQLCKLAKFGSSTASYIVGRLREKKQIMEKSGVSDKRGAKPVLLSINPMGMYAAAVELEPNSINMGLFDFNCGLIEKIKTPLDSNYTADEIVEILHIQLLGLLRKNNVSKENLAGIGVTLSGSITNDGLVELSSPLGWRNVPLKSKLSPYFDCHVEVYSTRVRLLSELNARPQLYAKNVLYVNVASGVSATILLDGKLVRGATGKIGEIGHTIVEPQGKACGCGNRGCLEAIVSGPSIARQIREDISSGRQTILKDMIRAEDMPEDIVLKCSQARKRGDGYAEGVLARVEDFISKSVCSAVNSFDPEVIILAGYVNLQCGEDLVGKIREDMSRSVYNFDSRNIEVTVAAVVEEALMKGVAIAILEKFFEVA